MPTTTNQPATVVDAVLHAAICDVAVKLVDASIVAEFPILANPITAELLDLATGYVANKIYAVLAQAGTFTIIDLQTDNEAAAANQAATALKTAQASGSEAAVAIAKQKFKDAMSALIHYDGSASP